MKDGGLQEKGRKGVETEWYVLYCLKLKEREPSSFKVDVVDWDGLRANPISLDCTAFAIHGLHLEF